MEKLFTNNKFLLGFGILLIGWSILSSFNLIEADLSIPGNPILIVFLYSFCLGWARYGLKNILVFVIFTFVISWSLETLSIDTGFPFGHYHYTDLLGPKLGQVPYVILPAYFAVGFLAWTLSNVLLGNFGSNIKKNNLIIAPIIAAFVMVMWDFCMDPVTATIDKYWIWENGGSYFGVPLKNYFGWFFTVYLIFQCFASYLFIRSKNEKSTGSGIHLGKSYWYLAVLGYFAVSIPFIAAIFHNPDGHEVSSSSSIDISFNSIQRSMALAGVMTMVFVSFLALILIRRSDVKAK